MVQISQIYAQKGFETLAMTLREQILSGAIQAGELLNERELVERSGLSRGSVREALRVLETQGLLLTKRGRNGGRIALRSGAESVSNSLDMYIRGHQFSFSVLIEAVEVFEPSLAELAALHRTDEDIAALQAETKKLGATSSPSRFLTANSRWHRAMAHASHNPVLTSIYDALGPGLLDPQLSGFASEDVRNAVVEAVTKVQEAIIERDPVAARRRMTKHVKAYRERVERLSPKA